MYAKKYSLLYVEPVEQLRKRHCWQSTNYIAYLMYSIDKQVRYRAFMSVPLHLVSASAGVMSGLLYGAINSTRFTLEQFEKLGDSYELGKIAAA